MLFSLAIFYLLLDRNLSNQIGLHHVPDLRLLDERARREENHPCSGRNSRRNTESKECRRSISSRRNGRANCEARTERPRPFSLSTKKMVPSLRTQHRAIHLGLCDIRCRFNLLPSLLPRYHFRPVPLSKSTILRRLPVLTQRMSVWVGSVP